MDEWIRGDPFCQTRAGNETNPFVENVDVAVQEVYDDELGFSERLVFMCDYMTKVIQLCTNVNNSCNSNGIISLYTSHIEVYSNSEVYYVLGV